jgi:hypothetical protein
MFTAISIIAAVYFVAHILIEERMAATNYIEKNYPQKTVSTFLRHSFLGKFHILVASILMAAFSTVLLCSVWQAFTLLNGSSLAITAVETAATLVAAGIGKVISLIEKMRFFRGTGELSAKTIDNIDKFFGSEPFQSLNASHVTDET